MNTRQTVNGWLNDFGSQIGIELGLDENGVCALRNGDIALVLELPAKHERLLLHAVVGSVPDDPDIRSSLYRELLRQNLLEPLASGGHFALDDEAGLIALGWSMALTQLSSAGLQGLLEGACQSVLDARNRLGIRITTPVEPLITTMQRV